MSYLAQEAIAQDRRSPQAWAIMGNCFSLQKVYPTALPCCSHLTLAYLVYKAGIRHYTHGHCFFLQTTYPIALSAMCLTLPYALNQRELTLLPVDALIRSPGGETHLGVPNLAIMGGCVSEPKPSALADQKHLFLSCTALKALRAPFVEPCQSGRCIVVCAEHAHSIYY